MQRSILNTLGAVITAAKRTIKNKLVKLDKMTKKQHCKKRVRGTLLSRELEKA